MVENALEFLMLFEDLRVDEVLDHLVRCIDLDGCRDMNVVLYENASAADACWWRPTYEGSLRHQEDQ